MSNKSSAIHKARKSVAEDPNLEKGFNNLVRIQGDYLKRKNAKEEKRIKEENRIKEELNAKNNKKKDSFVYRLFNSFSRKSKPKLSSKGGKRNRRTKRKNKK